MIENYVHWNEDIGEWQLVSAQNIAPVHVAKLWVYCVKTKIFLSLEMCGLHREQHEKTNACARQKGKGCRMQFCNALYTV